MSYRKIELDVIVTTENYDEQAYLSSNPDVATAVRMGQIESGLAHFEHFGKSECRRQRLGERGVELAEMRKQKMKMLQPKLRTDMPYRLSNGCYDFLNDELRQIAGISATENISSNSYDEDLWGLIDETADGLILDCGAGLRDIYLSNVVNFEIVEYDTTDVLGVGEKLPFVDCAFDGLISVAVLEHVIDPFLCAKEICRVLKPNGWIFCAVPFLQPYHGYPHHYFNMTHQGVRALFDPSIDVRRQFVNSAMTPIWALNWIVRSC